MYNKTFLSRKIWFSLFVTLLLINCCKPAKNNKEDTTSFIKNMDFPDSIQQRQLKNNYYQFPSAKEMFNYIKQEETLAFNPNLTNPVSHYPRYVDTKSKILNLGIYLADISYLTLYKEINKASEYLEVVHKLYKDLRIEVPFTDQFISRIKDNLNNEDSLVYISEQYSDEFYRYMYSNNKEHILATVSAGSYIEGLYIALNLVDEYKENSSVIQKIAEQKYTFENLYQNLNEFNDDSNIHLTLQYMEKILSVYNQLETKRKPVKTSKNEDNILVIDGGDEFFMSRSQFYELKSLINQLRKEIITKSF